MPRSSPSGAKVWRIASPHLLPALVRWTPRDDEELDRYRPLQESGGHAVCLVGYTADRFIVRNSWGTDWGDGGFAYASAQYAER